MSEPMTAPDAPNMAGGASSHQESSHESCTSCAGSMSPTASNYQSCSLPRLVARPFCWHCAPLGADRARCTRFGTDVPGSAGRGGPNQSGDGTRTVAGITAIIAGALGVHKFVLGDINQGLPRPAMTLIGGVLTLGLAMVAMTVIGWIEAATYPTMSDADFIRSYQDGDKEQF